MHILILNHMDDRAEIVHPRACAETREALEAFLVRERVEPYRDGQWYKQFRKGGPLEWMNPPDQRGECWIGIPAIQNIGTREEFVQRAAQRAAQRAGQNYDTTISSLTRV